MADWLNSFGWLVWGVALLVALPALVIGLGEASQRLASSEFDHYRRPLDLFRGSALFFIAATVLLRFVADLPDTHILVKLVDTGLWISILNAALSLSNALMFEGRPDSWQARAPKLLIDLGRVFIVALGAAMIVSRVWKIDLTGLLAALGVGSLVIGLALQDTLGNVFSGVTMLSASPFRTGSWIRIGDVEGQVKSVSWRTVVIATGNGDIVDVPNSQISKDKLRVIGAEKGWCAVATEIRAGCRTPPEQVKDALLEAMAGAGVFLDDPAPAARVLSFDANAIVYRATGYVAGAGQISHARSEFLSVLWYVARRRDVQFDLSPAAVAPVNLVVGESAKLPASAPASPERDIAALIAGLGTFQRPEDALARLAHGARIERYRRGELLVAPGRRDDAAFVVVEGSALATSVHQGESQIVCSFGAGDLVLFKSLLRRGDAPWPVRAATDLEAIRIPIATLEAALGADALLSQQVEHLLTAREESGPAKRQANRILPDAAHADRVQILKDMFNT